MVEKNATLGPLAGSNLQSATNFPTQSTASGYLPSKAKNRGDSLCLSSRGGGERMYS